jgi:hydroxyethylthiazole kinase-like uncharacterized protein yjeF
MPRLTRAQVREVDRIAIERYHIPGIVLMENAARAVTVEAWSKIEEEQSPTALIVCGGGNNGGDALAVARHLHNYGVGIEIVLTIDPATYRGDAATNWKIIQAMQLPTHRASADTIKRFEYSIILDGIFGTGLSRPVEGETARIIQAMNDSNSPILAIDLPSGLDCDTGEPLGVCINASWTVTFVAEKVGFTNPNAQRHLGRVSVAEIGVPNELIDELQK